METKYNYLNRPVDVQRLLLSETAGLSRKATAFLLGSSALFLGTN